MITILIITLLLTIYLNVKTYKKCKRGVSAPFYLFKSQQWEEHWCLRIQLNTFITYSCLIALVITLYLYFP